MNILLRIQNNKKWFVQMILILSSLPIVIYSQTQWTKHGSPVLTTGTPGTWDDQLVVPGTVMFQDTMYKMWYSGFDGANLRIGYATSLDGIQWTKHSVPILDLGASGSWDDNRVFIPTVYYDETLYHMWYTGSDGANERTGYATSPDGINWTKNAQNPVINLGPAGSWDGYCADSGPVVYDTAFHMIYSGFESGTICRGGYVTSSDGIHWTKFPNPVIDLGTWDTPRVHPNSIVYNAGTHKYLLFYGGGDLFKWQIGYATASNLKGAWTKSGKVLDVTSGSWDSYCVAFPIVLYDSTEQKYKMWYMGSSAAWTGSIGYATSEVVVPDTIKIPADYSTIQSGIDAAKDGDLVIVSEGTFYENIRYRGKKITVASQFIIDGDTSHISRTIIDGSQSTDPDSGSVVYFVSGEDTNSVLCGLTITGGTGTNSMHGAYSPATNDREGGGIYATSGARIVHNIITQNTISQTTANGAYGGGITCGRNAIVEENTISHNTVQSEIFQAAAGGIFISGSNSRLVNNLITNNLAQTNASNWNSVAGGVSVSLWQTEEICVVVAGNVIARNKALAPNCIYPSWGGGLVSYSISVGSEIINNKIENNVVEGKGGSRGGGICLYNGDDQLIKNNLVAGNSASMGGGIACYNELAVRRPPTLINNTVVSNIATEGSGSGMVILGSWVPIVQGTIFWDNLGGMEITGSANVQYCDIKGGYAGNGNIDVNPHFVDSIEYTLQDTSRCIDAGNPDPKYNDREDPAKPGFALLPGRGSTRNDIGAYGGDPYSTIKICSELQGPLFRAFVDRVNLSLPGSKQAIVDSFVNASSVPFIEENRLVYYVYQGSANKITIPGDHNEWNTESSMMTRLNGTNLWYYEAEYESDARLDYKFFIDGSIWICDPLNPHQCPSGFGPNSELAMPDYIQPLEVQYHAEYNHGSIEAFTFTSNTLANSRTINVYLPPGYDSKFLTKYPVALFHDGLEYLSIIGAANILDNLIEWNRIKPIICVFVPPVSGGERAAEYATTKSLSFENFIINELMVHIDSTYKILSTPSDRAMIGISYGGLITTQICYHHPESFGLAAPFSPGYRPPTGMQVYDAVMNGDTKNIKWYIDWGTYESSIMMDAILLKDALITKGYQVSWNQWHEAHSWGNWRAHLDNALEYFFPGNVETVRQDWETPSCYMLRQNYPNPYNSSTIIEYALPHAGHVTLKVYDLLGRDVATLINEKQKEGTHSVDFHASTLTSGVYIYQLRSGNFIDTKKLVLLK